METKNVAAGGNPLSSLVGRFLWWTVGAPRGEAAAAVKDMTRIEFDRRAAMAFHREGCRVQALGENDGGDLLVMKEGFLFLVLCREWRAWRVDMGTLQAFHNAMVSHGAHGGYVLTSGKFSDDVIETAPAFRIVLVNGKDLVRMLERGKKA